MIIKIKKYVAKVERFVEHEDGSITKEVSEIALKGLRFSEAGVLKQIPRNATLISHGYEEEAFEVDNDKLLDWCKANGKPVSKNTTE